MKVTNHLLLIALFTLWQGCTKNDGIYIPGPPPTLHTIDTEPAWSPDGTIIALVHVPQDSVERKQGSTGIWLLDLRTMSKRFLTAGFQPAWSPDGKKIAFERNGDIHTIDVETKQVTRLTWWRACFFPSWSPDGRMIAYDATTSSVVPVDSAGIWVMNADGTGKRLVLKEGRDPNWSPDGRKILFVGFSARPAPYDEIKIFNLHDSSLVRLTNNSSTDRDPAWSPDGSKIAWGSYGPGKHPASGIWVMNADGTNQRQLTYFGGFPTWSPDGKKIVYYQTDEHAMIGSLWIMNADGTNQHPLTTYSKR